MESSNTKLMREALNVVLDSLATISAHEDDIEFVRTWIDLCEKTIKEAIAAPPRNCDVYKTSLDVITHWDDGLDSVQSIVRMLDWLLATAAERK